MRGRWSAGCVTWGWHVGTRRLWSTAGHSSPPTRLRCPHSVADAFNGGLDIGMATGYTPSQGATQDSFPSQGFIVRSALGIIPGRYTCPPFTVDRTYALNRRQHKASGLHLGQHGGCVFPPSSTESNSRAPKQSLFHFAAFRFTRESRVIHAPYVYSCYTAFIGYL